MTDPSRSSAPGFTEAGNAQDHWRQQKIAALTQDQRAQFQRMQTEQERLRQRQLEKQQARYQQQIAEKMRRYLLDHKELHLTPKARKHKSPNDLKKTIEDYLKGSDTHVARAYQSQLAAAKTKAQADVAHANKNAQEKLAAAHKRQQHVFLAKAARARVKGKVTQEFSTEASRSPRAKLENTFSQSAKAQALTRAFERTVSKEADRSAEHEVTHDKEHDLTDQR